MIRETMLQETVQRTLDEGQIILSPVAHIDGGLGSSETWLSLARQKGVDVSQPMRRLCFAGPVALLSALGGWLAFHANGGMTMNGWGLLTTVLETLNLALLFLSSWTWFLGAAVCVFEMFIPVRGMNPPKATGRSKTAVLMPVCNEDATRVFSAVEEMRRLVLWTAVGDIDFFVLSDSRDPTIIACEEAEHRALLARIGDDQPVAESMSRAVHYRRRTGGGGRKAGNIREFCERWGGGYDYMLVLDADSMMSGRAIAHLVGRMDANPQAGIVQAMCYAAGKSTLFARALQWSGRRGGPVLARGVAFWQGSSGSWWGHNAIIRTRMFANACGLPALPGAAPLGGEILCHDIVEAALMVRAGGEVWLDHELGGSWEETPTNLVDGLARERRWCQGNMQHARILLTARGLTPTSRLHLALGVLHYASSLPLLLLLAVTAIAPLPVHGSAAALWGMLIMVVTTIMAPTLVGLVSLVRPDGDAQWWGGRGLLILGTVMETVINALVTPIALVFNLLFMSSTLTGRVVAWDTQSREDRRPGWGETWRAVGKPLLVAGMLAIIAAIWGEVRWPSALMVPGLLLSVPVIVLLGCPRWGARAREVGLFLTPEELSPPKELVGLHAPRAEVETGYYTDIPYALPAEKGLRMPAQVF